MSNPEVERSIEAILMVETLGAGEELHLEHVLEGREELTHRDGFGAGIGSGVGHGRQSLKPSPR